MERTIESSVLSQGDLCELAIQAYVGNWTAFLGLLRSSPQAFLLPPPSADTCLQVIDWLVTECGESLGLRLDESSWPKSTSYYLSTVDIAVVACMSPDDGRRLKTIIDRTLSPEERHEILLAYGCPSDTAMTEMNRAVAYLEQIAAAIADRGAGRLLVISY